VDITKHLTTFFVRIYLSIFYRIILSIFSSLAILSSSADFSSRRVSSLFFPAAPCRTSAWSLAPAAAPLMLQLQTPLYRLCCLRRGGFRGE
jgi:hypothetical protein